MSTNKPLFSIVIPTYNRAHLLPFAVKSILQQSFKDFEIVISNGGSTDSTSEIIPNFNDSRIKYFESKERLTAGENYQNGLNHAKGEYITFLSDDDAYTPNLLQRAKSVLDETQAQIVGYQYCRYYHDALYDFEQNIPKNSLLIHNFDEKVTRFSSSEAIEQIFVMNALSNALANPRFICPYLSNAVYRRDVFDKLMTVRSNLFDMVPADMYLAAAVFFVADSYYCLNEPLLVWSNWAGNATASAQRGENKVRDHYERLLSGRELVHTPLKFALALNCGVNAVLEAANELSREKPHIDWVTYFAKTFENFVYLKSVGVDTTKEEREFNDVLAAQSSEVQKAVKAELSKTTFVAKAFLNTRMPSVAAKLRSIFKRRRESEFKIIQGSESGFGNVVEASKYRSTRS